MQNRPDPAALQAAVPEASDIEFHSEGAYKAVYRAQVAGTTEAIKAIFIPDEEDQPEARAEIAARVAREIESLRELESPVVVKLGSLTPSVRQVGNHEFVIYSEEFLDAPTLSDHLRSGRTATFHQCKSLVSCLLEAIEEMKAARLVHRDIKPGNVVHLDVDDRPFVLLDLGVAFKLGSTAITLNPNERLGTLPYMAPEMFQPRFREMLDYRSDLYAAAVTAYEYASGTHPFARRSDNDYETVYRITQLRPKSLAGYRKDYPVPFCILIDQMMRKLPALRPSNITTLIQTLEAMT